MVSWAAFAAGVVTIIVMVFRWYGGKERKKKKELDAQVDGMKKGDAQSVLEAFDD